jgi:hypothetical protein
MSIKVGLFGRFVLPGCFRERCFREKEKGTWKMPKDGWMVGWMVHFLPVEFYVGSAVIGQKNGEACCTVNQ